MTSNSSPELAQALDDISGYPCAACGQTLGTTWTARYDALTDRQERVHIECPEHSDAGQ